VPHEYDRVGVEVLEVAVERLPETSVRNYDLTNTYFEG
jgi:hypothetical protein